MNVKIRDLDPKFISEIDRRCVELSNRTGNKWSRNDYLKLLVENDFDRPLMEYKQDKFDQLLNQLIDKFSFVQSHNGSVNNFV
ncbi:TPA: hypothetical protein PWS93_001658 [Enterococcus faecium]|nr:hypothetical protein [Enterococcus faecium]